MLVAGAVNEKNCKFVACLLSASSQFSKNMAGMHSNIIEKNYKKLVLRVSLKGFSFCAIDTLENKVLLIESVDFSTLSKSLRVEEYFEKAFLDYPQLGDSYDEVIVLHHNSLNTFVPRALFDEEFMGSYLQYNTKVFETDFFAFDDISNYEINHVYIPYANINNFLIDQFGTFDYRHSSSVLVSKILDSSKNIDEKQVFIHVDSQVFEIIVVQNQKLLLFNSFDYSTKEDFIYYLLFTAEQLNLNPESVKVSFLGAVSEHNELFQIAYKYIRHVSLYDVSALSALHVMDDTLVRQNFILLQS